MTLALTPNECIMINFTIVKAKEIRNNLVQHFRPSLTSQVTPSTMNTMFVIWPLRQ